MPSPPKNTQLDSKTIAYEFKMLCGTASRLSAVDPKTEWVMYNALVESFALHCRNLLAFFFGHDAAANFAVRQNDVLATDFCSLWSELWDAALFGPAKEQANKHIAHISTERQNVNFPGGPISTWDIPALIPRFIDLMERFLVQAAGTLDPAAEKVLQKTLDEVRPHFGTASATSTSALTPSHAPYIGTCAPPSTPTHVSTIAPRWMAAKSAPPDA